MTEHKTWSLSDACTWEGEPTTIGAVVRDYRTKAPAYVSLIARGIGTAGVNSHASLMAYDMACRVRRRKGGQAAAKRKPCHFKIKGEKR